MKNQNMRDPARRDQAHRTFLTSTAISLAALALLVIAGKAHFAGQAKHGRSAPLEVYALTDVSASNGTTHRKTEFNALLGVVDRVLPFRTPLHIWQFDRFARKYGDFSPRSSRDLWRAEDAVCGYRSATVQTRPSKAIREMLPAARQSGRNGKRILVFLAWDGGAEGDADLPAAVRDLAAVPNLRAVWLVGVKDTDGLRSATERIFAPLGDRLVVSGELDIADGFDAVRAKLRKDGRN